MSMTRLRWSNKGSRRYEAWQTMSSTALSRRSSFQELCVDPRQRLRSWGHHESWVRIPQLKGNSSCKLFVSDIQAIKQLQPSRSSSSESEASKATSYHISETVYEEPPQPNQIQVENHDSSESSSVDDDSSLDNEIIELCSKIESSNGAKSDGKDSSHLPSHDLAYQEEKKRQKKSDKVKGMKKHIWSWRVGNLISFTPPDREETRKRRNLQQVHR